MRGVLSRIKSKANSSLSALYIANFFFSLHFFFLVYINSSFLATYVGEELVGAFYVIASTISVTVFFSIARFLKKVGNYRAMILLTEAELLAILGIGIVGVPQIVALLFVMHLSIVPLIFFNLDIFLQKSTNKESDTGSVRGTFLTISSIAFILSPMMVGTLVGNGQFQDVYLISAMLLIPFVSIIALKFKSFIDPEYHILTATRLKPTFKKIVRDRNIGSILMSHLILRVFYTWILVYIPIYLNQHIGFSWPEIGLMLTIMLLPCIIFEYPLGKMTDKLLGEKKVLISGMALMGISTMFLSMPTVASFAIWTTILFITRAGSTATEIITESYFFKHVESEDTEIISMFRMLRPLAYIVSLTIALLALSFMEMRFIFIVLGVIILLGIPFAKAIQNTH